LQWEVNLIHSQDIQNEKASNSNVEALATPPAEQQTDLNWLVARSLVTA
jgi:hypothetical protein